ncbi:MAG: PASTA domain-containing protein, partial [Actinobacteria bacterium]
MDPTPQSPVRPRRALVPRWVPVVVAVLALCVAAGVAVPLLVGRRPDVTVPNVQGLEVAVARSRLGEAGLLLTYGDKRFSSTVPLGAVIEQDPPAGGVLPYRGTVVVIVSAGSEEFTMPDVLGMRLSEARTLLEGRGLVVDVEPVPSDEPSGTVLSSLPSPGATVRTSEAIRLGVASSRDSSGSLRPYALSGASFVLDPGTPPEASGEASGTPDAALEVVRRLRSLLEASGATVTVTRNAIDAPGAADDTQRAVRAVAASCTAVVGLSVDESAQGIAVYAAAPTASWPALYIPSADLARRISDALKGSRFSAPISNVASDTVLAAVAAPGVRVILGSVNSAEDRTAFRDPDWA